MLEKIAASNAAPSSRAAAKSAAISRQRIHQLTRQIGERATAAAGGALDELASLVNRQAGAACTAEKVEQLLAAATASRAGAARSLLRGEVRRRMERRQAGKMSLSAKGWAAQRRTAAYRRNNIKTGTIWTPWNELVAATGLTDADAEAVGAWCGITRKGNWALLRDDPHVRAQLALMELGQPASARTIGEVSGLGEETAQRIFRNAPWALRCGPSRWGLADWANRRYQGTAQMIEQAIADGGGSTNWQRLLEELPRQYGVTRATVQGYLRSRAFVVEEDRVRLRLAHEQVFAPLETAADGMDAAGDPWLVLRIDKERTQRGFSTTNVPPEMARYCGCRPEETTEVAVRQPPASGPLTISWRLSSTSGISIGRLRQAMETLRLKNGQALKLTFHKDKSVDICIATTRERAAAQDRRRRRRAAGLAAGHRTAAEVAAGSIPRRCALGCGPRPSS